MACYRFLRLVLSIPLLLPLPGHAYRVGLTQLEQANGGLLTIYYPAAGQERPVRRGPFTLAVAPESLPVRGNGRLIVISHGSGGSPWVHYDVARTLVGRGFTVALPQHDGDSYRDLSNPGPPSWRLRPREVSGAIDLIANSVHFARHLDLTAVGVFGGSAGGHTALSLAGGAWSEQRFRTHCERHIAQDFASCVGALAALRGSWLDVPKMWIANRVIGWRFSDPTPVRHTDARIKAALAMVPAAADFIPDSLSHPRIALGLVVARKDVFLAPAFHVREILKACRPRCELVMDLPDAGHGAMLSPMPELPANSTLERLLADPPGFQRRSAVPELNGRIARFFERHLSVP